MAKNKALPRSLRLVLRAIADVPAIGNKAQGNRARSVWLSVKESRALEVAVVFGMTLEASKLAIFHYRKATCEISAQ